MKALIKTSTPGAWLRHASPVSSPFSLLDQMIKDDFFPALRSDLVGMDFSSHMPAVNISEEADRYLVELSAPGFAKENFKIEVQDGNLVVSAESKQENNITNKKYSRREFSYGTFRKSFTLSDDAQEDGISAVYNNGILNITIPKKEEAKPRPAREIVIG